MVQMELKGIGIETCGLNATYMTVTYGLIVIFTPSKSGFDKEGVNWLTVKFSLWYINCMTSTRGII